MLREHVVGSRWWVVAHLGQDQLGVSIVRHRLSQGGQLSYVQDAGMTPSVYPWSGPRPKAGPQQE